MQIWKLLKQNLHKKLFLSNNKLTRQPFCSRGFLAGFLWCDYSDCWLAGCILNLVASWDRYNVNFVFVVTLKLFITFALNSLTFCYNFAFCLDNYSNTNMCIYQSLWWTRPNNTLTEANDSILVVFWFQSTNDHLCFCSDQCTEKHI